MLRWLAIGLVLASCESAPRSLPEGPAAPRPPHSREQLIAANDLHLAVSRGRLVEARDLARVLATDTSADVQEAAHRLAHAGDLVAAGRELGRLAGACGNCHAAVGLDADVPDRVAPADDKSLAAQMTRHAWGEARLWEGVTGPAEHAWIGGAVVIAQTPCDIAGVMHGKPNARAFELAELLHDQALRASAAYDLEARANLYSEVMSTCVGCHQILRPHPIVDTHRDAIARSR
jgi:cytochrome c553